MHFVKELFNDSITDKTHKKFIRYSRGGFIVLLLEVSKPSNLVKVSSSFHIADEMISFLSEIIQDEILVKGTITHNKDIDFDFDKFKIEILDKKLNNGIYKYKFSQPINLSEKIDFLNVHKTLLNFKTENFSLSMKSSFPKPSKEIECGFVKAKFPFEFFEKFRENFLFDVENKKFKKIKVECYATIDDIVIPKNIKDYSKAREEAKKKGKLKRTLEVDDIKTQKEISFLV